MDEAYWWKNLGGGGGESVFLVYIDKVLNAGVGGFLRKSI